MLQQTRRKVPLISAEVLCWAVSALWSPWRMRAVSVWSTPCTLDYSVLGLEHLLQIFPQGICNRVKLCLKSESLGIGPIRGVFDQFVYLGILNACGIQNSFHNWFWKLLPAFLTTWEAGSWLYSATLLTFCSPNLRLEPFDRVCASDYLFSLI